MDFSSVKLTAEQWVNEQKPNFTLVKGDEAEKRLYFTVPASPGSKSETNELEFYLTCPDDTNSDWIFGSDSDNLMAILYPLQDSLSGSKHKPIETVLQRLVSFIKEVDLLTKLVSDDNEDIDDDDDDDDDTYYPDYDVENDDLPLDVPVNEENESADDFFTGDGSPIAVQRLLKDLKDLKKSSDKYGISGSPKNDNLFIWGVELTDIPPDSRLGKDLLSYSQKYNRKAVVELEMKFPKDYPMAPPFVRVIRPRFKFLTGHVTVGGSICMQLLTKSGWIPTNDIETILIQIRCEILSDRNASLDPNPDREYGEQEAKTAFERMVLKYGWTQ